MIVRSVQDPQQQSIISQQQQQILRTGNTGCKMLLSTSYVVLKNSHMYVDDLVI